MTTIAAIDALSAYSKTQAALCDTIVREHKISDDMDVVFSLPKSGSVTSNGEEWSFARHGSGVRFTSAGDARIVDAHVGIVSQPAAFDAFRLFEYFESLDSKNLQLGDDAFDIGNEKQLDVLLSELADRGDLAIVDSGRRIYALV